MRRTLDDDPITGIHQEFQDNNDGSITIATEQDVESVLQQNLDLRNMFDQRADWKGDSHRVASIPNVVMDDLIRSGIAHDPEAFRKWLNAPENRIYRTRPGRV